jgi:hypothetical protein
VFGFTIAVALCWLALAMTMRRPGHYKSCIAPLGGDMDERLVALLRGAPGVVEAAVAPEEGVAYLKIEPSRFDAAAVARITGAEIPDTARTGRVQPV